MMAWTLNVRAFRIDNDLQFRLEVQSETGIADFKKTLTEALQSVTSDEHLVKRIGQLRDASELDSPHLANSDLDTIRSKIQVFTRVSPQGDRAEVKVAFHGYGSEGETKFLKRLCEDLLGTIRPDQDFSQVDQALVDIRSHLQRHVQEHDRFSNSLQSMVEDVDQRLAGIDQRMNQVWENQPDPVVRSVVESKTRSRERQLERLQKEKDRLLLTEGADSESLYSIQQQIDLVTFELKQIAKTKSPFGFQKNTTFQNVSFRKNRDASAMSESEILAEVSDRLGDIELDKVASSIEMIGKHRREDLQAPIEMLDQMTGNLSTVAGVQPVASLLEPGVSYVNPVGGKPGTAQIVLVGLLAIGFGSVLVWQLNPADLDRGFENSKRLASTLGVPVVSSFPLESSRDAKQNLVPARILKCCEILVLVFVLTVVVSCIVSVDVRKTMLENPFDGIARMIWLMKNS